MIGARDPTEETSGHAPSYYAATSQASPAAAALEGSTRADICIVGGGFTGLSAALRLAELGRDVLLLEAGPLGWGASGRNGGQVHVGMRRDQRWLEKTVGRDDARHLWNLALDARAHLDAVIADHAIDCDLRLGYLHGDHKPRYVPHTRADVDHLREAYGYEHIRFVDRDEIRSLVATEDHHGGSLDARGGHLHPLNLTLGLARAAAKRGARLHARTHATGIARSGDGWRVATARGAVRAETVLLACGGYLHGLEPTVDAHVMPINNFIAVTEPLGAERAQALIRDGLAVSDSRFVVYYYRMTPDHRLLFGGGESYSWRFPADIAGFVRPHIARVFPQLREVGIDYAWGGTLGITPTRLPFARAVKPGLYTISGYSGLGVVLAPYFGYLIGEALAGGNADFDRLARLPVPRFPGGRLLRWPTLVAAMSWFALRDRL